jgi:hypothetical protein
LSALVATVDRDESIRRLVFRPNQTDHPEYDDAADVFWNAVRKMYLKQPRTAGELPLLYWGFHSFDIMARRSVNGVLFTDRSHYLVDAGESEFVGALSQVQPDSFTVDDDYLTLGDSGNIRLQQVDHLIDSVGAQHSVQFLAAVTDILQATVSDLDEMITESAESLILSSNLAKSFSIPSRSADAKHIAELVSKWKIPVGETVQFTLSDATFAELYGLAVTDHAVYARDLMENVEWSPLPLTGVAAF